jgi:hypothetical protein
VPTVRTRHGFIYEFQLVERPQELVDAAGVVRDI